jgi:hypothetical protein
LKGIGIGQDKEWEGKGREERRKEMEIRHTSKLFFPKD